MYLNETVALIRATKGTQLSLLVTMTIMGLPTYSTKKLTELTAYSNNTVTTALNQLAELGLVQRQAHKHGWMLTTRTTQLLLPLNTQNLSVAPPHNPQNLSSQSSSSSKIQDPDHDPSTTTTNYSPANPQLLKVLTDAGIYPNLAEELAADPWVTEARVTAWISDLQRQQHNPNHTIRSLPALLAANLKAHRNPPAQRPFYPMLCPGCHTSPCRCDK